MTSDIFLTIALVEIGQRMWKLVYEPRVAAYQVLHKLTKDAEWHVQHAGPSLIHARKFLIDEQLVAIKNLTIAELMPKAA